MVCLRFKDGRHHRLEKIGDLDQTLTTNTLGHLHAQDRRFDALHTSYTERSGMFSNSQIDANNLGEIPKSSNYFFSWKIRVERATS